MLRRNRLDLTPEVRGADARDLAEARGERRGRLVADGERDIGDGELRIGQQLAGAADALCRQPLVWRVAGRPPEGRAEMEAAEIDQPGQVVESDLPVEVVAHEVRDALHLP